MNARQVNTLLWAGAAVLATGAAAALLIAATLPPDTAELHGVGRATTPTSRPAAASPALPSMADLDRVASVDLRQNLGEPGPAPSPVAVTPQPAQAPGTPLPVSLVGTIGTSLAMLKTPANAVEVCAVGDTAAGGVTVVAVRPAEVDVRYNGQTITLAKPKDPD